MKNVLIFLVAVVLLISAFKVFGQEAQAPVYKQGECWVFRSVSKNVTQDLFSRRWLD